MYKTFPFCLEKSHIFHVACFFFTSMAVSNKSSVLFLKLTKKNYSINYKGYILTHKFHGAESFWRS